MLHVRTFFILYALYLWSPFLLFQLPGTEPVPQITSILPEPSKLLAPIAPQLLAVASNQPVPATCASTSDSELNFCALNVDPSMSKFALFNKILSLWHASAEFRLIWCQRSIFFLRKFCAIHSQSLGHQSALWLHTYFFQPLPQYWLEPLRSIMLRHDFQALLVHSRLQSSKKSHMLQRIAFYARCYFPPGQSFPGFLLKRAQALYQITGSKLCLCFYQVKDLFCRRAASGVPSRCDRLPIGGGCSRFISIQALQAFIPDSILPTIDKDCRFSYIGPIDSADALSYEASEYLPLHISVQDAVGLLPLQKVRLLLATHGFGALRYKSEDDMVNLCALHSCATCSNQLLLFKKHSSIRKMASNRLDRHRSTKLSQATELSFDFPGPTTTATRDRIIRSACAKMDPESFSEAGCAVCGLIKPSKELSSLSRVGKLLKPLHVSGATRKERGSENDSIEDLRGPVIDHNCSSVCRECRKSLYNGSIPKLALANGFWLGDVPQALASLTYVEKMLVARIRHTCAYIKVASGQRKMKANIIAFKTPIPKLYSVLPPPREDMDEVLAVLFTGPCKPTAEDLLRTPVFVRRNRVLAALEWLKLNHCDYADIDISADNLASYEDNKPPVSIEYRASETNKVPEGTSVFDNETEDGTESGPCSYSVHALTDDQLESMLPSQIKAAAIRHLDSGGKMLAVGHATDPESIWNNEHLYPQMFPWLFPYGLGGIGSCSISDKLHKKHLLMYHDLRFQLDIDFPFVAFSHEQIKSSASRSFLLVKQSRFTDMSERLLSVNWETMEDLASRLEKGDHVVPTEPEEIKCFKILEDLDAMSSTMHGSVGSKKVMRNEIWSLINRIGAPYWYITLSPADVHNPICVYLASSGERFNPIPLPYSERLRLVCKNPVACARFFNFVVSTFIEDVLGYNSSGIGAYGPPNGYYGTVEQQGRLSLHLHLLLWIKGTLSPQEMRDKLTSGDSEWQRKIVNWLDSCYVGQYLTGSHADVSEKCAKKCASESYIPATERLPVPPPTSCTIQAHNGSPEPSCTACSAYADWLVHFSEDVDDLLRHSNIHTCMSSFGKEGVKKKSTFASSACMDNKWGKCKARFPRPTHDETHVDETGTVIMKKTEEMMNTVTPALTYLFRCNTDVTSLASGTAIKAVVMYVSDYITKSTLKTHTIFDSIKSLFLRNSEMLGGSLSMQEKARKFMTKIVNVMSAKTEMGAPLISMYLLGHPDHYTSHTFVPFYWQRYVSEVRRPFRAETAETFDDENVIVGKKDDNFVALSHVQDYVFRPEEFEHVSLYEWIRCYKRVYLHSSRGDNDEVSVPDSNNADDENVSDASSDDFDPDDSSSAGDCHLNERPVSQAQGRRKLPKNVDALQSAHPRSSKYGIRYIKKNDLRVPSFIGAAVPRRDKGDTEYYHCTMLTFFKPWRTGLCLKTPDLTWEDAFINHSFSSLESKLMDNFNMRYECMDSRDDYRARLKEGEVADNVQPWEDKFREMQDNFDCHALGNPDDNILSGNLTKPNKWYLEKLATMATLSGVLVNLGWTSPLEKGIHPSLADADMRIGKIQSGNAWHAALDMMRKAWADKKTARYLGQQSNDGENPPTSFDADVVKVVGKEYLFKTFHVPGLSNLVSEKASEFQLNEEQDRAFRIIANHSISKQPSQLRMYLGGMGGTGKSQVLKALASFFAEREESHRFVVVAPTGTAAALVKGSTYHHMFGINEHSSVQALSAVRARMLGAEYVFFDEVSMLSARDLCKIHNQLAKVSGNSSQPFGGLNMVFAGDFAQLPPALGGEAVSLYSRSIGRVSSELKSQEDAIGKGLWHQITTVVILRQNMRQRKQSPDDAKLRRALENLRYKACDASDIAFLRSLNSTLDGKGRSISAPKFRNVPVITGTNALKDVYNALGATRYSSECGRPLTDFFSDDQPCDPPSSGRVPRNLRHFKTLPKDVQDELWNQPPCSTDKLAPGKLSLCLGMPVMIRYNYATELCMTRGQEAIVVGWQDDVGARGQRILDVLFVKLVNPPTPVHVDGLAPNVVPIYPRSTSIIATLPNGDRVPLKRKQVDVLLNFSMTDYASQGKTREFNPVDLFSLNSHQGYYTALSRCATAEGTLILRGFKTSMMTGGCSGFLRQEFRELELLDSATRYQYEGTLPLAVSGDLRKDLISSFRKWKGKNFVPETVHKSIRWSKKSPFLEGDDLPIVCGVGEKNLPDNSADVPQEKMDGCIESKNKRSRPRSSIDLPHLSAKRSKTASDELMLGLDDISVLSTMQRFSWSHNSCAYDAVFNIMFQIFVDSGHLWNDFAISTRCELVMTLFKAFDSVFLGTSTLNGARDGIRRHLEQRDPANFRFGSFTSIDALLDVLLFVEGAPSSYINMSCPDNHDSVHYALSKHHITPDVHFLPSTASWSLALSQQVAATNTCRVCGNRCHSTRHFMIAPEIIAFDWGFADCAVEATVSLSVVGVGLVQYKLKGVVYYGNHHFTSCVVDQQGVVYYHDGVVDGGRLTPFAHLGDGKRLESAKGRLASVAVYVKAQTDFSSVRQ